VGRTFRSDKQAASEKGFQALALQGLKPATYALIDVGPKAPTHKLKESFDEGS
jgi:hypothetical protein